MAKSYRKDIHGGVPYYDDYDENKKFLRIMSRPGFPLQAREITQLQTILQDQIERLGDHFFEEGAVVRGGEITEFSSVAIRLDNETIYTEEQLASFIGKTIRNTSGVQATIVAYADRSDVYVEDGYQILFANYTTGSNFQPEETLTIQGTLPLVQPKIKANPTNEPPAISQATNIVAVAEGFFYADGFLIKSDEGTIAAFSENSSGDFIYRDYSSPSASVGFKIERDIVTADQDETLKDPSFGFFNFNSPGADRYKITLQLDQIPLTETNRESYFELVRIDQGNTTKQVRYTDYAIFEETLARRTYDESGHYTVSPFNVTTLNHEDAFGLESETSHAIQVSSGKAYINGYEFETIAPSYFPIRRAFGQDHLETLRIVNLNTPLKNYVSVEVSASGPNTSLERDMFANQRAADLETPSNEIIGTCNIRTIQEMPLGSDQDYNQFRGEFRLALFNINMNPGKSFKDVTKVAVQDNDDNVTNVFILQQDSGNTELKNAGTSRQIFKAPVGSGLIKTNRDDLPSQFVVRKPYNFDVSSRTATVSSDFPFLDANYTNHTVWYTTNGAGGAGATMLRVGTDVNLVVNNNVEPKTVTLNFNSSIPDGGEGTLIATQRWTSESTTPENNIRIKTLVEETDTSPSLGGVVGTANESIVVLDHTDVYEVTSITDAFGDVTDRFDLDVNQTNEAYYNSRLILKAGFTCGTDSEGRIQLNAIDYRRFSHSGEGPFTVDSYPINDTFTYDDIPVFADTETGERYSLADAFDFRPIAVSEQNDRFDNGSGGAQVVALNNPAFSSFVSYVHYMPRIDKLVLDSDRTFKLIEGIPSNVPSAPVTQQTQMVVGEFTIPPYTVSPDDIKYRHIDNQRVTMSDINEIEQNQQYDQYWSFTRDSESRAINRAKGFRPDDFVVANSVLVDTFIGHNNAITSVRDHNCSIDPEDGTLRPAFESSFHHMGLTAASLGGSNKRTTDNIYMLDYTTTDYTSNLLASDTIKANQFGVPDFLGTMQLSPGSDPYFSTIIKPKVMVNVVGEVDNWESNIVAYQRGRTRGFGSQWRDWETLWFGSKKRNDVNIEHDTFGSEYSAPRRSSFVSRVLSDKITRKIGDKIVDLSVIPYTRSRTITFTAKNLKPNTNHSVYFEGQVVNALVETDENGEASGSFDIPARTFLTGKKLVRIQDATALSLSSSSADAIYYAEGLLNTRNDDVFSARPEITRRKSANSEDVSADYFEANADGNLSPVLNSVTPFAQEIYVDPTNFTNGLMLSDITLFFSNKPTVEQEGANKPPVKLSIRPMYQGSPHPYKVLPFSEVTKNLDDVVAVSDYNSTEGNGGTKFEFSTPVYLRPGRSYAICISTNSTEYELYMGVRGENARGEDGNELVPARTILRPTYIRGMHLPSNNGQLYESVQEQYFKMNINRCVFNVDADSNTKIRFRTSVTQLKPLHAFYIHANEQVTQNAPLTNLVQARSVTDQLLDIPVEYNTTYSIGLSQKLIIGPDALDELWIDSTFNPDPTGAVSPMIDGDRIGIVAVEYMANNDDGAATTEEVQPNSRIATNRSRYISRKVTLEDPANDMAVFVDGTFAGNSQIKVYVKIQGTDTANGNFDDNNWIELYPEGIADTDTSVTFNEVKPEGLIPGSVRFTSDRNTDTGIGNFTEYQIKIVLMGQNAANSGNASQVPIIESIAAVPLRSPTQDVIRRFIPVGTILPFAGEITANNPVPSGFLVCQGQAILRTGTYSKLFERIGTKFGVGNGSTTFNLPDLRGRIPVGKLDGSSNFNARGDKGGSTSFTITQGNLPPHTHRLYPGKLDEDDIIVNFITSNGSGSRYTTGAAVSWTRAYNPNNTSETVPHFWASEEPALPSINYYQENEGQADITIDTGADQTPMNSTPIDNLPPYLVINYIIKT